MVTGARERSATATTWRALPSATGANAGDGATPSVSHVARIDGSGERSARERACSCAAQSGQRHWPRVMPHMQWCSGAPPSAATTGKNAGPSHIGASIAIKNANGASLSDRTPSS